MELALYEETNTDELDHLKVTKAPHWYIAY